MCCSDDGASPKDKCNDSKKRLNVASIKKDYKQQKKDYEVDKSKAKLQFTEITKEKGKRRAALSY